MNRSSKYEGAFFIYPKDRDGNRMDLTICVINKGGRMYQGQALLGSGDTFSYETGRKLAYKRALAAYNKVQGIKANNAVRELQNGGSNEARKVINGGRFA